MYYLTRLNFEFWDFYKELSPFQKLLFSACVFGDFDEKIDITSLKHLTIENYLKTEISDNEEYRNLIKVAKSNPDELITRFPESNNLITNFNEIISNLYNGKTKQHELITSKIIAFSNIITALNLNILLLKKVVIITEDINKSLDRIASTKQPVLNLLMLLSLKNSKVITNNSFNIVLAKALENAQLNNLEITKESFFKHFEEKLSMQLETFELFFLDKALNTLLLEISLNKITNNEIKFDLLKKENSQLLKKNEEQLKVIQAQKNEITEMELKLKETKTLSIESLNQDAKKSESEIVLKLYESIQQKDAQIEKITKQMLEMEKTPKRNIFQTLMENQEKEIIKLRYEKDKIKEEFDVLNKKFKNPLSIVEEYILENGLTEKFLQLVMPLIDSKNEQQKIEPLVNNEIVKPKTISKHIGYISFDEKENKYVAIINSLKKIEVVEIPERTLLSNDQFVLIDDNGIIYYAYNYKYKPSYGDFKIEKFAILTKLTKGYQVRPYDTQSFNMEFIRHDLKDGTIIALDKFNGYICFYKSSYFTIDDFIDYTTYKNQKFYFVEQVLQNGLFLREVENGENHFYSHLDKGEQEINEHNIILVQDEKIITVSKNIKLYTMSSFYNKYYSGTVKMIDNEPYLKTLNNQVFKIFNYPLKGIEDGVYCTIDEFFNFMSYQNFTEEDLKMKNSFIEKRRKLSSEEISSYPELIGSVLIVGNQTYQKTYKETFRKSGFDVTMINGYDSWNNINTMIKNVDFIVVISNHISHENMWKIKESATKIQGKIIYPKSDGANRIIEEILNLKVE